MWIWKSLRTKSVVLVGLMAIATGCGQNANIAKKDVNSATQQQDLAKPRQQAGILQPAPAPLPAPIPSAIPALQSPIVGAVPPVFVLPVADGKNGKDGKDGKDGVTIIGEKGRDGCGEVEIPAVKFDAVKMEKSDFNVKALPYMSRKKHPIKVLQLGQSNRRKKGESYVEDAQVLFKFPLRLPPRDAVVRLHTLRIRLAVTKVSEDAFPDTEWLCFLDQKICSGKVYDEKTQKSWQANINHSFWSSLNNDFKANDEFVTQLKGDKVGRFKGMTLWKSESFELDVASFIKNSKYPDLLSFLYEGADPTKPLVRDLRVAVADDTLVSNATFTLEYMENTCKTFDLQAPVTVTKGN